MRWRDIIQGCDPYEGFPTERFQLIEEGWGSDSPVFEAIIKHRRPEKIIEVGSWTGASAMHMSDLLRKYNIDGEIVCVDTWLGTAENWMRWKRPIGNCGHPLVFFQFMTNVILKGHTDRIVPFPIDAYNASIFFKAMGMQADVIYIDASHDYTSVRRDIMAFWDVLKPQGTMIGDDYSDEWPGVKKAVTELINPQWLNLDYPGKWVAKLS